MDKKTNNKSNLFNWLFKDINLSFLTSNKINNPSRSIGIFETNIPSQPLIQKKNKNTKIYSKMNSQYDEDQSFNKNELNVLSHQSKISRSEGKAKEDNQKLSALRVGFSEAKEQSEKQRFLKSKEEKYNKKLLNTKNILNKDYSFGISNNSEVFNENLNAESSFNKKKLSYKDKEKLNTSSSKSRFIETSKQQVVSITYEEIGLFPRSFNRVFDRFFKQLFFDVENLVIQEYRFYRYLFLTTVKCVFILLFVPLTINFIAKNYFVRPITEYYWNSHQMEIFLNSYQQKKAFTELKNFEEKIYFESLIFPMNSSICLSSCLPENNNEDISFAHQSFKDRTKQSAGIAEQKQKKEEDPSELNNKKEKSLNKFSLLHFGSSLLRSAPSTIDKAERSKSIEDANASSAKDTLYMSETKSSESLVNLNEQDKIKQNSKFSQKFTKSIQNRLQLQTVELAKHYNEESIEAITNFFADLISLSTLFVLLKLLEIQINITKSFLLEVFFGLDDSKKSLLILFITDLLVGYHSPNIWELFFSTIFDHYGLPESQTTIFLLVATLPVLLDVLFKYLIFRHLNRASPATVATYHAMIE
uniref:Potassium/proton antiporter CemA n=1 Tax=Pseudopediastrum boryanum TaxID=55410 RepID=A0A2U8GIW5_PSEBY|nr:chloroplast envelope membrane protein [Pseudopediastrum boryanum]AWI68605.1 chloroplast envelope membrane protein [Pseudopediastrum boryanum]